MDAATNPFAPGAGLRPVALVGLEIELDTWAVALRRVAAQRSARSVVLQGLRGVGKTVLLGEYHRMATKQGWMTAVVEGGTGQPLRTRGVARRR